MVLGIVGGVLGIVAAIPATVLVAGSVGADQLFFEVGSVAASGVMFIALVAGLLLSAVGIVGGVLVRSHLTTSWVLLLVSAVLGFAALHVFWIPAGLCLLVAGGLAIAVSNRAEA